MDGDKARKPNEPGDGVRMTLWRLHVGIKPSGHTLAASRIATQWLVGGDDLTARDGRQAPPGDKR